MPHAPDVETAARVRANIREALRQLSNRSWQARAWSGAIEGTMSSFVETVCALFDDSMLGDALASGTVVFDRDTDDALRELRRLLASVDPYLPIDALIALPTWDEITRRAQEIVERGVLA